MKKKISTRYFFFIKGTLLVIAMLVIRAYYTHGFHYLFLLWNLILAFIPFKISSYLLKNKLNKNWKIIYFFCWLFFFPNAPYIITDLTHLLSNKQMPIWYDGTLIFIAALNGLWIGCMSLMQMEQFWRANFPQIKVRYFIGFIMLLSGFGIYLGRFLRFNTWDIIVHPFSLLHITYKRVLFFWQYFFTWEITFLFGIVLLVSYYQIRSLMSYKVID